MKPLGVAELRLLRKLVIDPSVTQAELARELGVTRSAVNQIWQKLRRERQLSVCGSLDYGQLGMRLAFGWAKDKEGSETLQKFSRWLKSSPLTMAVMRSVMSSMMDSRVYFEAVLPQSQMGMWFLNQLERFKKKPYNLSFTFGVASHVANHMNLGLFDGRDWEVIDGFRFGATIDSAKGYADVLPDVQTSEQSQPIVASPDSILVASLIEQDYYATSRQLEKAYNTLGKQAPSERTLRRRLAALRRRGTVPYVSIENIGLSQRIVISLEEPPDDSSLSRLLQVQATTFPKARVVHDINLTSMVLDLPESASWFAISQVLSESASVTSKMCTFIAENIQIRRGLESLTHSLVQDIGEEIDSRH
ncbi:MAG: AsnC family protein [Candidatus Thorarchaeota archaeon]